ncbi:MAG: glycosyltransferase, partial [Bacteroidota bacterium]
MKKYKGVVCHVSVLHYRKDLRIFVREAASLARAGYEVHLIVADGLGDETAEHGIRIHDVGQRRTTLRRLTLDHYAVYQKALSIDAALYHFHDPELLLLGWLLKRKGKRVISDVHEDYPLTLRAQKENSYGWRRLSGWIMDRAERTLFPRHDAVITTSPVLLHRLKQYLRVPLLNIGGFP